MEWRAANRKEGAAATTAAAVEATTEAFFTRQGTVVWYQLGRSQQTSVKIIF